MSGIRGEERNSGLAFSSCIVGFFFFYLIEKVSILCNLKNSKERKNIIVSVSNKASKSGHLIMAVWVKFWYEIIILFTHNEKVNGAERSKSD